MGKKSIFTLLSLLGLTLIFALVLLSCGGGGTTNIGPVPSGLTKTYLGSLLKGDVVKLDIDEAHGHVVWENETLGLSGEGDWEAHDGIHESQVLGFSGDMAFFPFDNLLLGVFPQTNGGVYLGINVRNWGTYQAFRNVLLGKEFIGAGIDDLTGYLEIAKVSSNGDIDIYKAWYESALSSPYTDLSTSCSGDIDLHLDSGCHSTLTGFLPPSLSSNMTFDGYKLVIDEGEDKVTIVAGYLQDGRLFVIIDNGENQGVDFLVENNPSFTFNPDTNAVYKDVGIYTEGSHFSLELEGFLGAFIHYVNSQTLEVKHMSDSSVFITLTLSDNTSNWPRTYRATEDGRAYYFLLISNDLQAVLIPSNPDEGPDESGSQITLIFKTDIPPM